jgi:hypothetical protein
MKNKKVIIGLFLSLAVLFSILFQGFHNYEHFLKLLAQKECHHKYNVTNTEITHQHHKYDQCDVCQFTFGSYISPEIFTFQFHTNYKFAPHLFEKSELVILFSGSLYALRGPPIFNI